MSDQHQQLAAATLAYRNFVDTCRSQATREAYVRALHYFMDYLRLPHDQYDRLLPPMKDPKVIQMNICDFVSFLRKKGAAYASISSYVSAINKFYTMNDIVGINWKKVNSFMGEYEKTTEDRPYTHSEIQTLISNTSLRNKAIILLMSSSGLRVGAISILRLKDLEPIDKYQIYKVNIYARSKKSAYFSFCTPEARKEINFYLDHRKRWGERLTDDSPLFRTDYNPQAVDRVVKPVSFSRMRHFIGDTLRDTGLRKIPIEGKPQRSHIMMNHGLRKFFETNAFKAGMDHMYIRRLMGQKSGLEDAYLKLSEEELLEGDSKHVGYIDIIGQLTIDDSNRLRREVEHYKIKADKIDELTTEFAALKQRLGL